MEKNRVTIKTKDNSDGVQTEIYIDDCLLKGVKSYELKHKAGCIPVLTLELAAIDVSIDTPRLTIRNDALGELEIKRKVG